MFADEDEELADERPYGRANHRGGDDMDDFIEEDYAEDEDDGESGEEPESDSNDSEEDSNAPGRKEPEVKSGSDEALQDSFNKLDLGEPEKTDGPQSASIVSAVAV